MTYQFDSDLAKEYGVENAVMLQNIHFWCRKNAANKRNYFEGHYWTYNSQEAFAELFQFWSRKQVMRVLKNCQKMGAIKVSNFNQKSNNRTHWYTVTKYVENFLGPVFTHCPNQDKPLSQSGQTIVPNGTNIYKDTDNKPDIHLLQAQTGKIADYDLAKTILKNAKQNIENAARQNRLKIETVESQIEVFVDEQKGVEHFWNNRGDLLRHFLYWMRKQDLTDLDIETSVNWFIEKFNQATGREYVVTDEIKKLFAVQLQNGFTGAQMVKAVKNLYHHNNEWHRKNNYEHATPQFLLKDENLNKYLNAKY